MMFRRVLKSMQEVFVKVKDPLSIEPKSLFEFQTAEDLQLWKTTADSILGGKSSAMIQHKAGEKYASFCGIYSREIGENASPRLKKSGFVSMIGRHHGAHIDLETYQSLVYKIRGDGRTYLANVRTDNWIVGDHAEDIWQAVLTPSRKQEGGLTGDEKPGWEEVELPLDEFVLTYRGRVVEHNVEMNKSKITGLGISLLGHEEQPEGSYSLDVQWIKARHAADVPGKPIELDGDSTGRRVEGL